MIEHLRVEFVLEAQSPIAHHEGTFGNSAIIMRQKVRRPDGSWCRVPIVTGDTMRHGLREASTYALLDAAGMLGEELTESALRLLFAGGMVTGSSGSTVRLDEYRRLIETLPTIALLGGCAGNRIIPGAIEVDAAQLICEETAHLLPPWVTETQHVGDSCRAHVEEVQRVRMDPTLDPGKRKLLRPVDAEAVQQRLLASATATDAVATDDAKSSMMPRRFETVVAGSRFFWSISARLHSELERDTFMVMVATFLSGAVVGGKRGTGHGKLKPITARNVQIRTYAEKAETFDLGAPVGQMFRAHVAERADALRAFLRTVAA